MDQVTVSGLSVAYELAGKGPAIVLLHGFTHDSRAWQPQLDALSDEFTVIAWDAPGAGRSDDPPGTYGIGDWAGDLLEFLRMLAVERAHLLGLSWGGLLAQEFYRRYPERVTSLILADTYAGWSGSLPAPVPEERLAACIRDSSLPPAEFVDRYLPGMFGQSVAPKTREALGAIMGDFHPAGLRLMAAALAHADTRDLLPTIKAPTLLIWGDKDVRSPMSVAHQMHDAIGDAELVVIPGGDTSATCKNQLCSTKRSERSAPELDERIATTTICDKLRSRAGADPARCPGDCGLSTDDRSMVIAH